MSTYLKDRTFLFPCQKLKAKKNETDEKYIEKSTKVFILFYTGYREGRKNIDRSLTMYSYDSTLKIMRAN